MEKKKPASVPRISSKVIPIRMDAAFYFERAVRSLDRLHYEKALKYFRRAVEFEPDNAVNHCNMAGILSEMGHYAESNEVLQHIVDHVDPGMTECYFYMANNYANMELFEEAEQALVHYLERDASGQFLEEAEEMIEMLGYELGRSIELRTIKSREGQFEHDRARMLLETGKFPEAVKALEKITMKRPELLAARNNLALAYYYTGEFDKSLNEIRQVLAADPGNLHGLCNLAIFYHHFDRQAELRELVDCLERTVPFHLEHLFKLATTMGILKRHESAYRHFRRLLDSGEGEYNPYLYHYAAVAAWNSGRRREARSLWRKAELIDPDSSIPKFYLSELDRLQGDEDAPPIGYTYHLPFEEQLPLQASDDPADGALNCPLVRSSFLWALRHGDFSAKLQVLQLLGKVKDREAEAALQRFVLEKDEDDYLKKLAIFALRKSGSTGSIRAVLGGKEVSVDLAELAPGLPVWKAKWQSVVETALAGMEQRYGMLEQHDLQTLWIEFLTRAYPRIPAVTKVEGWAAALEYLTAKMYRREITYQEVADRYGASVQTISKHVKTIDRTCGLREKMEAIFPKFTETF